MRANLYLVDFMEGFRVFAPIINVTTRESYRAYYQSTNCLSILMIFFHVLTTQSIALLKIAHYLLATTLHLNTSQPQKMCPTSINFFYCWRCYNYPHDVWYTSTKIRSIVLTKRSSSIFLSVETIFRYSSLSLVGVTAMA